MKIILACLILTIGFIQLHAQSSIVAVDVRYRIDPKDTSIPAQQLFVSRLDDGFSNADKKTLLDLTASRILYKTSTGDSVLNYDPAYDLFPGFSSSTLIADCKMITPADFSKPAGQIGDQSWVWDNSRDYFRLKKGKVTAGNLTVQADKQIAYATDTLMTENGDKMIPLLKYRYLQPEQVSIFFIERWNFDPARGHMEKSVRYYGYFIKKYTSAGDYVGHTPILCIQNPEPAFPMVKKVLIRKNLVCDVAVNWPEQKLRNDTNLRRYAGADAANYLTIPEGNIPEGERSKMLAAIFKFALNNPGNVCRVNGGIVDSLHYFTSAEQIEKILIRNDSFMIESPADPNVWLPAVMQTKLSLGDVYAIRFYEDWYYDEKDFAIKKVVRGIGLIMMSWSNTGLPILSDAGIYIKLN